MALFPVVLEFDGGTYISQFRAVSVRAAVEKHAFQLIGNKGMSTLANRRRLADRLSVDQSVAIEGIRNVWCCSFGWQEICTGEHPGNCLMGGF